MSSNVNKPVAVAVSAVLLGGMALSTSAFAMNDLAAGYLLGATAGEKAGEGKCGEGKCGTAAMDTNKDGKISKEEFAAHMGTPGDYAKYDTNKDGYIDNAEMTAAHGGGKKSGAEGKCGEGKCGGAA